MGNVIMVAPIGVTKVQLDGVNYYRDENGHVTVPSQYSAELLKAGFGADGLRYQASNMSHAAPLRLLASASAATALAADAIVDVQHPALGEFYGMKLVYANYSTSGAMIINGAAVAPCPVNAANDGTTLTWTDVKFSGSASGSVPAGTAGATVRPGTLISDFVALRPTARTDAATDPYLVRVRSHISAGGVGLNASGGVVPQYNAHADNPGLKYASQNAAGLVGSLKTAAITPVNSGGAGNPVIPVGVIYYYSAPAKSLFWFGDSLWYGTGPATTAYSGAASRMVWDAYGGSEMVTCANYGVSGQAITDSYATALAVCAAATPTHIVWKPWSINSGATQANHDACWAQTLDLIEFCRTRGITPVICTSPPTNGSNWAMLSAINARVASLSGVIAVDLATAMNDPSRPGVLLAAYDSGDHTHWTDAGHQLCADMVLSAIRGGA